MAQIRPNQEKKTSAILDYYPQYLLIIVQKKKYIYKQHNYNHHKNTSDKQLNARWITPGQVVTQGFSWYKLLCLFILNH